MTITKLIKADEKPEFFNLAADFLKPQEKFFCALMERIENKEDTVYVIAEKEIPSCKIKVSGVFSFNKGRNFTAYIPEFTDKIISILENFFKKHEIFCLVGEKSIVEVIEKIYGKVKNVFPEEKRQMYLMQYDKDAATDLSKAVLFPSSENDEYCIKLCKSEDADLLFSLHTNYSKNEVLPDWKNLNLAAERIVLEKNLKKYCIAAVYNKAEKKYAAKAQTNAVTKRIAQLGGVYTDESERKKGFAGCLINFLAKKFSAEGKTVILFVRQNNPGAIRAYEKAGLKIFAEYKMDYYL